MLQPIAGAIKSGYPVFRFLRGRFFLSLSLLILLQSPPVAYPRGDVFQISLSITETNRAASQNSNDARVLEVDKPIERELAGGEAHSYQLTLAAGQYARVVVDQRRINVALWAFDSDGKKFVESDLFFIGDSELVSFVADTSAIYRLEVRSPDKTAPKGSYEIKIKELRAATEQDKSHVAAERLMAEGILLEKQLTADSWRKAIEKYQQAIPFCQSAKEPAWEATALYLIANDYINLGEKQKAFDFSNRALPIAEAAARQTGEEQRRLGIKVEAITLDIIGRVHNEFGDKKKALELFNQALPLKQAIGDRGGEVITLNNIGMAYGYMGESRKALDHFIRARLIASELGDRGREASLLNNVCVIHSDLGEYKKAIDFCSQAISIRRDLKDRSGEAVAISNMGNAYSSSGEYQKALDFYNQALAIQQGSGNHPSEAISLNNIGWVYATLGEYQKAIDFYNRALEIFRTAGDQFREANVLSNIATNYADLKDFRRALEINQRALGLRRASNNREGQAISLNNIAGCYSNLGEKPKALDYYNQSIALHRNVGNPRLLAITLKNFGALYRGMGQDQKALDYFNEGLQLSRTIGDRNNEAGILAHIARLERDRGKLVEARSRIEEALAAVESLRINVKSHQLRASFLASVREYYEFDIDVLMRLHKERPSEGFDAAALEASERGRARSLLELLSEAHAEIRQGVDPLLIERELTLRHTISDKAERQMRMLSGRHTEEQATAAAREMDALTTEHEQIQSRIRETSPRYAALTQPVPLGLKEIQQRVLDDGTLLLEYALGEQKSFLWAVTPTWIKSFELPKRAEIEQAARRVYELSTARNKNLLKETPEQRRQRLERADKEYSTAAASLSRMLLGSVASELKGKRLLIVGDGILQYVSFAALPQPSAGDGERGMVDGKRANDHPSPITDHPSPITRPLVVDNEIVSLPSASVVAVLRRETATRKPAGKTLAVLADPVFSKDDPRVSLSGKSRAASVEEPSPLADAKRSAAESGLADLVRLRFSRQEADAITRLATHRMKLEAVDFEASRALAASAEIGQYRIVHFATHGLINNEHPELAGVVLSLVDEQGRPQNGFLRLYDIYNLKLAADLVVLSACQTALGKEIRGEGIVGLTRGFMYAGAERVVASLWRIDDRATAELMRRFYQAMLQEALPPAAALRAAQVSMWREKRWQSPYYWAAFTLQGEWK